MTQRPRTSPTVGDPRAAAERLVEAWVEADYERDDVDPSFMSERSVERLIVRITEVYAGQLRRLPGRPRGAERVLGVGHPLPVARDSTDEDDLRSPDCPAYHLCLEHAVRQGWEGFTCRGCSGPGDDGRMQGRKS